MSDAYDSPWKEILQVYFEDLLAFAFPEIHREVDWSRGYESLDQELPKIFPGAATGRRVVDKLMKVWRKDGVERMVFLHVELQSAYEADFALRMYTYNYRIFDRTRKPVVSLAILGDDRPGWRPGGHGHELWGCKLIFEFPVLKLWDYHDQWRRLEASRNPFAVVVMAHLKTRATRTDPASRFRWKIALTRSLYERGYARRDVVQLFRFIDWLLSLPSELQERFDDDIARYEAEKKMRYVTHIERRGIKKGMHLGEASLLRRLLTRRFENLPAWVEDRLRQASTDDLENWAERILDARSLEDVFVTG